MSKTEADNGYGFCTWFTGLSGAGKTTTAEALKARLECHGRRVTMLDGDVVRQHLSKGLGFSKEDRDENVRRIGYVASLIVDHGGVVLCSLVSPYIETRQQVRSMFPLGGFLEVYVATSPEVCEERDVKGLYERARAGELKAFTGIDDPYQVPPAPEITLDTSGVSVEQNVDTLIREIVRRGLVRTE